jgi:hypothetical protein
VGVQLPGHFLAATRIGWSPVTLKSGLAPRHPVDQCVQQVVQATVGDGLLVPNRANSGASSGGVAGRLMALSV